MNPYIISKKTTIALIDYRASIDVIKLLENRGLQIIKTIKCSEIDEPVDGHPDMVVHPIDTETLLAAPNVFDYYCEIFKEHGIKVIKGEKYLSKTYPDNIAYNVARIKDFALHNLKYTDEVLRYHLEKTGVKFEHVNQGYTKCSTVCVGNNAAITSDIAIHNKLNSLNIKNFFIESKHIHLEGYNCGFIGGCLGAIDENTFLITGKLEEVSIRKKLKDFINNEGFDLVEGSDDRPVDLGTVIVL